MCAFLSSRGDTLCTPQRVFCPAVFPFALCVRSFPIRLLQIPQPPPVQMHDVICQERASCAVPNSVVLHFPFFFIFYLSWIVYFYFTCALIPIFGGISVQLSCACTRGVLLLLTRNCFPKCNPQLVVAASVRRYQYHQPHIHLSECPTSQFALLRQKSDAGEILRSNSTRIPEHSIHPYIHTSSAGSAYTMRKATHDVLVEGMEEGGGCAVANCTSSHSSMPIWFHIDWYK